MGSVVSCGLKLVLQILNTVLCIAFLAVAVIGLILKSSKDFARQLLEKIFSADDMDEHDTQQFIQFISENAGGIAVILIVVGLVLGALCLVGCIASTCGCGLLMKIYAAILIVLLVGQIIAVAVMFSSPDRLAETFVKAAESMLPSYGKDPNSPATTFWNVIMTSNKDICCGLKGYTDFPDQQNLPEQCCKTVVNKKCGSTEAAKAHVKGCQDKITTLISNNLRILFYVSIGAILLQAALLAIVMLAICL